MLATQLDLFGAPPRPPAKIRVEEAAEKPDEVSNLQGSPSSSMLGAPIPDDVPAPLPRAAGAEIVTSIHVQLPTKGSHLPVVAGGASMQHHLEKRVLAPTQSQGLVPLALDEVKEASTLSEETVQPLPEPPEVPAPLENEAIIPMLSGTQENVVEVESFTKDDTADTFAQEETVPETLDTIIAKEAGKPLGVPEDDILFRRQYYTMRETVGMLGLSHSVLRYWENEFTVLKPRKNRKGDRYFRPADIKNLQLIHHLLKVRKFTIEGAREYLKNQNKALDTFEMVQRLERIKHFLQELKENAGTL